MTSCFPCTRIASRNPVRLNLSNQTKVIREPPAIVVRQNASLIIQKAYEQQKYMFDHDVCSCLDRIVSIFQSHVRPIVRGKAGRKTEYGAKIGVSVVNGFTYIDHCHCPPFFVFFLEKSLRLQQIRNTIVIGGYWGKLCAI